MTPIRAFRTACMVAIGALIVVALWLAPRAQALTTAEALALAQPRLVHLSEGQLDWTGMVPLWLDGAGRMTSTRPKLDTIALDSLCSSPSAYEGRFIKVTAVPKSPNAWKIVWKGKDAALHDRSSPLMVPVEGCSGRLWVSSTYVASFEDPKAVAFLGKTEFTGTIVSMHEVAQEFGQPALDQLREQAIAAGIAMSGEGHVLNTVKQAFSASETPALVFVPLRGTDGKLGVELPGATPFGAERELEGLLSPFKGAFGAPEAPGVTHVMVFDELSQQLATAAAFARLARWALIPLILLMVIRERAQA